MTLDEGVRSGQVTVTEAGDERGLIRPGQPIPPRQEGAQVNRLVLYNNSSRPLLLLAGEIVTGGQTGSRHWFRPHRPAEYRTD